MAFANDYVEVHVRVGQFLEKYPDGRIQTDIVKHTEDVVIVRASVYRDAEDERPNIAHSQLGIPGKTNFTRDSEVENAETSAVGRALAFMGFETKKGIASREEVESRQGGSVRSDGKRGAPLAEPERPAWYAELFTKAQAADLRLSDIGSVIGVRVTKDSVQGDVARWLASDPAHSIEGLVSQAADMKAAVTA